MENNQKTSWKKGQKVCCKCSAITLGRRFSDLTVVSAIPDGAPVGNGETNRSGETVYLCREDKADTLLLFRGSELRTYRKQRKGPDLREAYHDIRKEYRKELTGQIRYLVGKMLPAGADSLNINALHQENCADQIGKYTTPKDEPCNFVLYSFRLENGKAVIRGADVWDEDHTWDFNEEDFNTDELEEIYDQLGEIREAIDDGEYTVDGEGNVEPAED